MSLKVQQAFQVLTGFQQTLKTPLQRDFEGFTGDFGLFSSLPNGSEPRGHLQNSPQRLRWHRRNTPVRSPNRRGL